MTSYSYIQPLTTANTDSCIAKISASTSHTMTNSNEDIITLFFNFLQKESIGFSLINGYKNIGNNHISGSDIDILLKKNDFTKIESILTEFTNTYNLTIVQILHHDLWAKNIFLFDPENNDFLNLDLYGELSRKDVVFSNELTIFSSLSKYKKLPILATGIEFISYLVKCMDKNTLDSRKFNTLSKLYQLDTAQCNKQIDHFFPRSPEIVINAFISNNLSMITDNAKLLLKGFTSLKSTNLHRDLFNIIRVVKRVATPTGITIAFLGSDGSGKSTIIDRITHANLPFRRTDYFHLKPLKTGKNKDNNAIIDDPHKHPPYSSFKSYLKLIYFIYQYNFGWVKNILFLKRKSSLIIFDRYYDDLLVDSRRYRYGGSLHIAKLIKKFIPQPDIYFILTGTPDVIYSRKQEVAFEELERQVKSYESLVDNKRYFKINVDNSIETISAEVIKILMEKMNERR